MRNLFFLILTGVVIGQTGCIPKKENKVRENLVGTWDLTNHCHEFGTMSFDSDNTGTIWVNDECIVGSSCLNVLPFNWTLDEESGLLRVMYDPSGSALMVCSDIQSIAPPSETEVITENTQVIFFYGYTFEHR